MSGVQKKVNPQRVFNDQEMKKHRNRQKPIILDITISSDEETNSAGEKSETYVCGKKSNRDENDETEQNTRDIENHVVLGRSRESVSQKEKNTESQNPVMAQTQKSELQASLKDDKLQGTERSVGPLVGNLLGSVADEDPNDTDDFCGGITPYRAVVTKNMQKQEQLKRENKLARRGLRRKRTEQATVPPSPQKRVTCENSTAVPEKCEVEDGDNKSVSVKNVGLHYCQICQGDITGLGVNERTDHVNACIDKNGHQEIRADDKACTVCQICKKDLSRYNSQRKTQHVNRCADELEDRERKRREEEAALEKARNRVLDCPLCGQHLKTSNGRKTHMKRCALTYGVSVVVLQQRIQQQEEEYARELEAGLIPLQPVAKKRKKSKPKTSRSASTTVRSGEPISKADADLQLAVALSESIAKEKVETSNALETNEGGNAFGVLMTPKVHKHTKRKAKLKPTPALLTADEENVSVRLSDRVARLVVPPDFDEISPTPQFPKSCLNNSETRSLWDRSVGEKSDRSNYYVEALMPPLVETTLSCGSKIRRLSSIPGRGDTSLLESPENSNVKEISDLNNTTMIATTQTALLLAEMDEDQSLMNKSGDSGKFAAEQDLNATGFIFPDDDDVANRRKAASSYERSLNQQEKMINNKMLSDLSLETADGVLYAHKYPIAMKCPSLFKVIEKVNRVDLKAYSNNVVLALLRYLYVDDTSPKVDVVGDLKLLAVRFGIQDLVKICCDILERQEEEKDEESFSQTNTPDLSALLKRVWGSDEESDESSEDETTSKKEDVENEREEAEIDAVYEFMASQRSNGKMEKGDTSDSDLSEVDEGSRLGGKLVHNSQHSFLGDDILKELLTPGKEVLECAASKDISEDNTGNESTCLESDHLAHEERADNGDMDLHLTASEADEISEDEEFVGSPLVRKLRKSMEPETSVPEDFNEHESVRIKHSNYEDETTESATVVKSQILVCERCPLSKTELSKLTDLYTGNNLTMARRNLEDIKNKYPNLLPLSVTICNKCSPCKEVVGLRVKESDKETMCQAASRTLDFASNRRRSSFETPVMSRTWSATTSATPDLFDASTATEEYSMNLSQLSVHNRTQKCSTSTSELFNDDDILDGSEENVAAENERDIPEPAVKLINKQSHVELNRATGSIKNGIEDFDKSPGNVDHDGDDDDDVVALSQEEVAKLPKSRSPSPVFGSQTSPDLVGESVVKEEKEGSDIEQDIRFPEPDWLKIDTPKSTKPKKIYSFKSKKSHKLEKNTSILNKEQLPKGEQSPKEVESPKVERRRSSLSLSQKRKKRRSSEDSMSSSRSFSRKKSRIKDTSGGESETGDNVSLHAEDDAIDLTQEESPEHLGHGPDLHGQYENADTIYDEVDDIPWQDDDMDDGVLIMEEPSTSSLNQSSRHHDEADASTVYDPPTDMDTDYSTLCNDSVLWNNENEPKVPSGSQSMLKTPSAPAPKSRKKPLSEWVPPSPFTPMPNYDSMATPELKRQCKKYGIRPLPKKRMQATLKTIHAETHAYETDSDFEQPLEKSKEEVPDPPKKLIKSSKNSITRNKGKKTEKVIEKEKDVCQENGNYSTDSEGTNDMDSSRESFPDLLEESMMPGVVSVDDDEEDITPSQINASPKSKAQRALEKKTKKIADMRNYFRNDHELLGKILQYEVFEFDELKDELANAGIKVGNEVLTDFLDEMNIQFTLRNHQGGRQRKKGKGSPKKAGSPKKRGRRKQVAGSQRSDEIS